MAIVQIRVEFRDLPRLKELVWELRQIEDRLRVGGHPEAAAVEHAIGRFLADISADEPEDSAL